MDKTDRIAVGIGLAFLGLLVLGVLLMLGGMMMMGDKFDNREPSPSPTPTQRPIARDPAK
jgi:hypothetical protein